MDFPSDDFAFAAEWLATQMLRDYLPLRSRERAYYTHRIQQFEQEAQRRMAQPVQA